MSTSPDGAPRRPAAPASRAAGSASPRRSVRGASPSYRPRNAARPSSSGGRASGWWRRYGPALAGSAIAVITVPISFFVWYSLISLGAYPGDRAMSDLIVGVLYTALIHALLLVGVLLGVSSIRARRREKRPPIAGWIAVVLNVLVLVYWELLVSPWLVVLWNRAVGA